MTDPSEPQLKLNVPVLRKALEHITAHPEEWEQDIWATKTPCGTACCLAGTVVVQQGYELVWEPEAYAEYDTFVVSTSFARNKEGKEVLISETAMKELVGASFLERNVMTVDEAYLARGVDEMFAPTNTIRELWEMASELSKGEIEVPADLPEPEEEPSL